MASQQCQDLQVPLLPSSALFCISVHTRPLFFPCSRSFCGPGYSIKSFWEKEEEAEDPEEEVHRVQV